MAKPTRWVRLSVDVFTDDKISGLSYGEQILFFKLILHAAKHQTDGRITSKALKTCASGHRRVAESIRNMVELGLLYIDQQCADSGTAVAQQWVIAAFARWQMNTDAGRHETAGQAPPGGHPSRARTWAGSRTEQTVGLINKTEVQPTPMRENITRVLDGIAMKHNGNEWVPINGTAT